jgi:hypothetical protein
VLARAVDAGEGLLVQQALQPYFCATRLQRLHDELLVVGGDVGLLEDRRDLVLAGATSLWRVFTGTPSLNSSRSTSSMNASTRSGMAPK